MKTMMRFLKHLSVTRWLIKNRFPPSAMSAIENAISSSESLHMGELRFVVEAGLDLPELISGVSSRERAIQVFSNLRIWDTEHNSGVLIYLLLADRKVEIVADRGINSRVSPSEWLSICHSMESKFRMGEFEQGTILGITAITEKLKHHFPAEKNNPNDLSNKPIIL